MPRYAFGSPNDSKSHLKCSTVSLSIVKTLLVEDQIHSLNWHCNLPSLAPAFLVKDSKLV